MNRLKPNFSLKEEDGLRVHIESKGGIILEYEEEAIVGCGNLAGGYLCRRRRAVVWR